MLDLILLTKATEKIAIVQQNNQIIELAIDRPDMPQLTGSIFLGKVITVDQSLQAAFVDIGQPQLAYLEKNQIPKARKNRQQSIEKWLFEGQSIVVQVIKDAYQDKGARLTMNVTLANQVLVYLPYGNYLAVSKKLPQDEGNDLKAELKSACQDEEGLIIRTQATDYSTRALISQIEKLRFNWQRLAEMIENKSAPTLLHNDHAITDRFIRRFPFQEINQIYSDQVSVTKQIKRNYPELEEKVTWVQHVDQLLSLSIEEQIQKLLVPEVSCKHGVTIVIDHTEALTVIDVNSSGYNGVINQHQFAYKVNRIAVAEIAKQIRLRNLSGMIVIDFLRMTDKKQQIKIIGQLTKALKTDPTLTEVYGFTALGLLELTRKRETPLHYLTITNGPSTTINRSLTSMVFVLERELIASQDQAIIVEVTKGFRDEWEQWIDHENFIDNVKIDVYFIESKGVHAYHVRRSGSDQLIAEYLLENTKLKVDKIN